MYIVHDDETVPFAIVKEWLSSTNRSVFAYDQKL